MSSANRETTTDNASAQSCSDRDYYETLDEDDLFDLNDTWPVRSGAVCLVACRLNLSWIMLVQTPDVDLLKCQHSKMAPPPDPFHEVIRTFQFADRVKGFGSLRRRIGLLATERANYARGVSEWFKIPAEVALAALT